MSSLKASWLTHSVMTGDVTNITSWASCDAKNNIVLLLFTIWLQGQVTGPILPLPGLSNKILSWDSLTFAFHAALLNVSHANAVGHFPLRRPITLYKGIKPDTQFSPCQLGWMFSLMRNMYFLTFPHCVLFSGHRARSSTSAKQCLHTRSLFHRYLGYNPA